MAVGLLFKILGKIFLMVLFGYILKKLKIITDQFQSQLSNLLIKAILPISILSSSCNEFSKELSKGLLITAIVCLIYYISSLFIITMVSKKLHVNKETKKIFITMTVFANVGFIGFPIATELFGNDGILYAVIYNMFFQIFFFTYGTNLLSNKGSFKITDLLNSPVTISSFLAIIIYLSPFRFPLFISESLSTVGGMMVPLSMMIIGCSLVGIKPSEILKDKYSYLVSLLRLVLLPLITFLCLLVFDIKGEVAIIITILTALPSGSLNAILAEQYNCNPKYATRTVVQTMVLMIITLPIIIAIAIKYLV